MQNSVPHKIKRCTGTWHGTKKRRNKRRKEDRRKDGRGIKDRRSCTDRTRLMQKSRSSLYSKRCARKSDVQTDLYVKGRSTEKMYGLARQDRFVQKKKIVIAKDVRLSHAFLLAFKSFVQKMLKDNSRGIINVVGVQSSSRLGTMYHSTSEDRRCTMFIHHHVRPPFVMKIDDAVTVHHARPPTPARRSRLTKRCTDCTQKCTGCSKKMPNVRAVLSSGHSFICTKIWLQDDDWFPSPNRRYTDKKMYQKDRVRNTKRCTKDICSKDLQRRKICTVYAVAAKSMYVQRHGKGMQQKRYSSRHGSKDAQHMRAAAGKSKR